MGACFSKDKPIQPTLKDKKFIKSGANVKDLNRNYKINYKCLGAGQFGKVFEATNIKDPTQKIAVKCVSKKQMDAEDIQQLEDEIKVMGALDHPNIAQYFETYSDKKYIYLCSELCTGGELFQRVTKRGRPFTEKEAAIHMRKLLKALIHCHAEKVIHRDIKPENIMFGVNDEVKLIDFGFAVIQTKKKDTMDIAGTPYYIAPEVLTMNYGEECDIWSLGIVLFQLLTGGYPFDGNNQQELFEKVNTGKFDMPKHLSSSCQDLLNRMITLDPKRRITAEEAVKHKWFIESKGGGAGEEQDVELTAEEQDKLIENLKRFEGRSVLKRAAVNIFVKHLEPEQIRDLRQAFEKIDSDGTGFIEPKELRTAIESANYKISQAEIDQIIENLDYAHNDKINYSEFLAATIDVSEFLTNEKLEATFFAFDVDNCRALDREELKLAFSKFGRELTDEELEQIMKEHDLDKDDHINLEEFKTLMLSKGSGAK